MKWLNDCLEMKELNSYMYVEMKDLDGYLEMKELMNRSSKHVLLSVRWQSQSVNDCTQK